MKNGLLSTVITQFDNVSLTELKSAVKNANIEVGGLYFTSDYSGYTKVYLASNQSATKEYRQTIISELPSSIQLQVKNLLTEATKEAELQKEKEIQKEKEEQKQKEEQERLKMNIEENTQRKLRVSIAPGAKVFGLDDMPQQKPQFPGGDGELKNFINGNVHYPPMERDNDIQGEVLIRFIVNEDGSVSDIIVSHSVSPALDKEAIRVISLLPDFIAGKNDGKPVKTYMGVPITFSLQ